jgi:hypothetical protein
LVLTVTERVHSCASLSQRKEKTRETQNDVKQLEDEKGRRKVITEEGRKKQTKKLKRMAYMRNKRRK